MSEIREEFEKAFQDRQFACDRISDHYALALWAAKWMAGRLQSEFDPLGEYRGQKIQKVIRQLAKDLDA